MKTSIGSISLFVSFFIFFGTGHANDYNGKPYEDAEYKTGMQTIPGRVLCAYYDLGGEGIAYHDETKENHGSGELNPEDGSYLHSFRVNEGVDISYTKSYDTDNSRYNYVQPPMNVLYVGWTSPGEWVKYTVDIKKSGKYTVGLMYTSYQGGKISLSVDNVDKTGPIDVYSTYREDDPEDWRQWHHWNKMNNMTEIILTEGVHVLTLHTVEAGQMNYAWLDFELVD